MMNIFLFLFLEELAVPNGYLESTVKRKKVVCVFFMDVVEFLIK